MMYVLKADLEQKKASYSLEILRLYGFIFPWAQPRVCLLASLSNRPDAILIYVSHIFIFNVCGILSYLLDSIAINIISVGVANSYRKIIQATWHNLARILRGY
ncbi:MAG: hypothetical protein ABIJ34_08810 [archaeon]